MMDVFMKNKRFRQIALANFFSMTGDKLFYLAMLTYVSTLPQAQIAIGLITASELIPQMFASLTGYWADGTKHRGKALVFADGIRATLYMLVGFLFISDLKGWVIVISVAVLNIVSDFYGTYASGLRQPLIVEVTGKKEFAKASGFTQGMSQTISIMAQFIGASLLLVFTYWQLALVNSLTFIISAFIMYNFFRKQQTLAFKHQLSDVAAPSAGFFNSLRQNSQMLKNENRLMGILATIILLNGMLSSLVPLIQLFLVKHETMLIQSYPFTIAILNTTISVGLALGGLFGLNLLKQVSLETLLFTCLITTGIFYPVLLAHNIWGILTIILPICFLVGTIIPKLSGWLVQIVAEEKLALTVGMLNTALVGLAPLIALLIITIASIVSPIVAVQGLFIISILLVGYQSYQISRKNQATY